MWQWIYEVYLTRLKSSIIVAIASCKYIYALTRTCNLPSIKSHLYLNDVKILEADQASTVIYSIGYVVKRKRPFFTTKFDGKAMGSTLAPVLAKVFIGHHENA